MRGDLNTRATRTASGATAVQVVPYEDKRRIVVKHMGSVHDEDMLAILLAEGQEYAEAHRVQPSFFAAVDAPSKLVDVSKIRFMRITHQKITSMNQFI